MKPVVSVAAASAFLQSGRIVMLASHVAAAVAGFALFLPHRAPVLFAMAASLAAWAVVCYLAMRVSIDAVLFDKLASAPADAWSDFDDFLRQHALANPSDSRAVQDRIGGAMRLWKRLLAAAGAQGVLLAAGCVLYILSA